MSDLPTDAAKRVVELREEFDRSFASPFAETREEVDHVLAIRLRGDPYGLRVREIDGVERSGAIVPLPSESPGLLGIAGYRGAILPVYDLGVLLGYEGGREAPRWLVLCGKRDPLALGVEELDGYVSVPISSLHAPDRNPRRHVERFSRIGDTVRAIVNVSSIIGVIQGEAG